MLDICEDVSQWNHYFSKKYQKYLPASVCVFDYDKQNTINSFNIKYVHRYKNITMKIMKWLNFYVSKGICINYNYNKSFSSLSDYIHTTWVCLNLSTFLRFLYSFVQTRAYPIFLSYCMLLYNNVLLRFNYDVWSEIKVLY